MEVCEERRQELGIIAKCVNSAALRGGRARAIYFCADGAAAAARHLLNPLVQRCAFQSGARRRAFFPPQAHRRRECIYSV